MYLLALEQGVDPVFADTGHEHKLTVCAQHVAPDRRPGGQMGQVFRRRLRASACPSRDTRTGRITRYSLMGSIR